MKIRTNDYCNMTTKELEKLNLRWGKVNLNLLLTELGYNHESNATMAIMANPNASDLFERWMERNLTDNQIALLRLLYGTDEANYHDHDICEHDIFGAAQMENEQLIDKALKTIDQELEDTHYLGHVLTNWGFGGIEDEDQERNWKLQESDSSERESVIYLFTRILGVSYEEVDPSQFWLSEIGPILRDYVAGHHGQQTAEVVSYAVSGIGELWLDEQDRIYGFEFDKSFDSKCYDQIEKHVTAEDIELALRAFVASNIYDPEAKDSIKEVLYLLALVPNKD